MKKRAEAGDAPHGEPAANQQPVSGLIGATLFRLRPELYLIPPPVVFSGGFFFSTPILATHLCRTVREGEGFRSSACFFQPSRISC